MIRDLPELFVLRHGETEWNRAGRMQGGLDSPLTPLGIAQSRAMSVALAAAGVGPVTHRALCSPQGRAVVTAALALQPLGLQATPDPRLREIALGDWAGLDRDAIDKGWPGLPDEHYLDFYARAPNGEGFDALWDRVCALLADLTGPTVIVTHGMTSRVLRSAAMGLGPDQLDALPGGQGVVFHLAAGKHEVLGAPGTAPDLHGTADPAKSGP